MQYDDCRDLFTNIWYVDRSVQGCALVTEGYRILDDAHRCRRVPREGGCCSRRPQTGERGARQDDTGNDGGGARCFHAAPPSPYRRTTSRFSSRSSRSGQVVTSVRSGAICARRFTNALRDSPSGSCDSHSRFQRSSSSRDFPSVKGRVKASISTSPFALRSEEHTSEL